MAHEVLHEIVEYSGVAGKVTGGPIAAVEWIVIFQAIMQALMKACPAKFANQQIYEETYDKELGRLMRGKDHCPLVCRLALKRHGIKGKAAQDQAYFRAFTAANGYKLWALKSTVEFNAELSEV